MTAVRPWRRETSRLLRALSGHQRWWRATAGKRDGSETVGFGVVRWSGTAHGPENGGHVIVEREVVQRELKREDRR
ncbi:MAG: hypothetical protein D6740_10250 [Alphaproteobacteria bacterium]|nr:MAG: hypothetical protein D6740_10250 [Alphaproteobacteria bacterium]